MISIYKSAFASLRQFWWFYLTIAVLLEIGSTVFDSKARLGAEIFLQISFLFFLHRNFLLGQHPGATMARRTAATPAGRTGFYLLTVAYLMILVGLTLYAAFNLVRGGRAEVMAAAIGLFVPLNWAGLSLFGTAFPASAIGDRFGLALTLQRAKSTAAGLALRLALGPGLSGVLGMTALIAFAAFSGISVGLDPAALGQPPSATMLMQAALGLVFRLFGLALSALGVATLCDAYRRIMPAQSV